MQNFVHFADEGPKGTSKEIFSLWFLLLGEGKTLLSWENKALLIGRGSAVVTTGTTSQSKFVTACMTYILTSPKQILSEPASLATQNTMADFIWIFMGLKLYQTSLHFGSAWRATAGIGFISR